ncbi:hypothetical protein [Roseomonas indoligenes]|uniref:Uncharacterized protein n=1 Tax=Roseomonas indoligenes TaxID=2820811 RepID=A0A940S8H2_9PROT|nr:hypothetical protein [Pararoseomonas indoligenes]MBP0496094.1 hypothetical protein [Pararoseomonas indoligenes]
MSPAVTARTHLIERAAELLGDPGGTQDWRAVRPLAPLAADAAAQGPAKAEAAVPPPVIAAETLREAGLVMAGDRPARSRAVEEIAVVQHQMLRTVQEGPRAGTPQGRIVLVTSALPGEGKTFAALNLAAAAAGGAAGVVLVDMDGREGGCSGALGTAGQPGLRQLASDPSLRPAGMPLRTAVERLTFLPHGSAGDGAEAGGRRDLPSGAAMAAAILRLASALPQHVIVLDTPPSLSTSEASTLASIAGQVILVVDAERTQRNEVEAALDLLEACPVLQLLLNRARFSANDTFGAHGDYGAPDAG